MIPRTTWDTALKVYIRNGLHLPFSQEMRATIPRSNISRWKKEPADKCKDCGLQRIIESDREFLLRQSRYPGAKKLSGAYIELMEGAASVFRGIKKFSEAVRQQKEAVVTIIEGVRDRIAVSEAIKLFGISRTTYQHYKNLVINKCQRSYFEWCVRKYPHQLVRHEIVKIKKYLEEPLYRHWSKSSVYYQGLREKDFGFCLASFYKYAKLLGFSRNRHVHPRAVYRPLSIRMPDQIWCADVTQYRTVDGRKYYLHILLDHFSRMVLGYKIAEKATPAVIRKLLEEAVGQNQLSKEVLLVTDEGGENVNQTVQDYLSCIPEIRHRIAQKDIPESNSVIEAFNKVLKNQFLRPALPVDRKELEQILERVMETYNKIRPQHSLLGNTPSETYHGKPVSRHHYKSHLPTVKALRKAENEKNACKGCV